MNGVCAQLPDFIFDHIVQNGPMKTSGLRKTFDGIDSRLIRSACETNPKIIGLKIRRCNYWLTKNQFEEYRDEIYGLAREMGIEDPDEIIKTLGNNALRRDILQGVIEWMQQNEWHPFGGNH